MLNNKKISVVIPTHNRKQLLEKCLICFKNQTYRNYNIIVVNDGSTDGTSQMIKNKFPNVVLLEGNGNLWWTGSVNVGIKYALNDSNNKSDYLLIINDDVEISEKYLKNTVKSAIDNPNSLIGSVEVNINRPEIIFNGGVKINPYTAKHKILNKGEQLSNIPNGNIFEVSRLTGRGVLVPRVVFDKIGLYDDDTFKQHGDVEFTVRARKSGFNLFVCYNSVVMSHVNESYEKNVVEYYSLRDIYDYFFNLKSNSYLKDTFNYSRKTKNNFFQFIIYFSFDLARKLKHFIINIRSI